MASFWKACDQTVIPDRSIWINVKMLHKRHLTIDTLYWWSYDFNVALSQLKSFTNVIFLRCSIKFPSFSATTSSLVFWTSSSSFQIIPFLGHIDQVFQLYLAHPGLLSVLGGEMAQHWAASSLLSLLLAASCSLANSLPSTKELRWLKANWKT